MQFSKQIEAALTEMRPSEADVARHLLRDPARIASNSLREVAAWCGTSDATVLRACRAAGFDGYQDLKYHVLRELTTRGEVRHTDARSSSLPTDDMLASLSASQSTVQTAARTIQRSKRVAVVGSGASGGVGYILADVLCALGKHALVLSDDQAVGFALAPSASNLVLVAISHSGETSFPIRAVQEAKRAKVPTIGLTNEPASELGLLVDVILSTQVIERPEGSFSIVPRLCQLAILDQLLDLLEHNPRDVRGKHKRRTKAKPATT